MFSKKGALELSISLLVIIIISLVILVGGIIFLYFAINSTEVSQQLIEESLEENSVANQVQDSAKQELIREENIENNTELEESPDETKEKDCLEDFTCDDYFIYVPLGEWERQELFEVKAEERAHFFVDISKFKFRKVGNIYLSLDFVNTACKLTNIRQESAPDHLKIKRCADRYADSLGIDYEKAIGLTNSFTGG